MSNPAGSDGVQADGHSHEQEAWKDVSAVISKNESEAETVKGDK